MKLKSLLCLLIGHSPDGRVLHSHRPVLEANLTLESHNDWIECPRCGAEGKRTSTRCIFLSSPPLVEVVWKSPRSRRG